MAVSGTPLPPTTFWVPQVELTVIKCSAGGQYISTRDLELWGRAILQSTLLPKAMTRRWLKPHSVTAQWASDVGVSGLDLPIFLHACSR